MIIDKKFKGLKKLENGDYFLKGEIRTDEDLIVELMDKLNITKMKKSDFEKIPYRNNFNDEQPLFDYYVIIPTKRKHESGWNCIEVVGCIGCEPICKLTGCSDVLHINGMGGYGYNWLEKYNRVPDKVEPKGFKIDCLPCGYLRIFCVGNKFVLDNALSDFEIFAKREEKKDE